jgi:hypothetical protein
MSDDQRKHVLLLDEVIRELETLMRASSAIGLDRARLAAVLARCREVRAKLAPPGSTKAEDDPRD